MIDSVLLSDVWHALRDGRARLARVADTAEEHVAVLELSDTRRAVSPHIGILERLLEGASSQQVAIRYCLGISTITVAAGDALESMGIARRPSRVPALVVLAFQAAQLESKARARAATNGTTLELRFPRCDRQPSASLSTFEALVLRLVVEGNGHEEVAQLCSLARRATANRIAGIYRTLGVSGRRELVVQVARQALAS